MYRRLLLSLLLTSLSLLVFAQASDTTVLSDKAILLPEAQIVATPIRNTSVGSRVERWDAEALKAFGSSHLGQLLEQESGIFIKSYGIGSSATSSIRGAGAGHTTVLWNGLPLQSPMLGQLDFSLMPLAFTEQVQLQFGGNTAAWGSGAIGGVVALENEMDFQQRRGFSLQSRLGNFGLFEQQALAQYGSKKWRARSRLFYRTAQNDFPYRLAPDLPQQRQTNAALQQAGLLQELYWRPSQNQQLALHIWAQQSEREIPPTTVQTRSQARQEDAFLRTALHWKSVQQKVIWQARAGLFRERLDFFDPQILLESRSNYWVGLGEFEGDWQLSSQQRVQFGLNHTWMQAEANAFETSPQQHRTALFAVFRQQLKNWQLQGNARIELVDGRSAPIVGGLGFKGRLTPWLNMQGKASRNYRLPSFNDLYWQPGGNPELEPETGWSQELGLHTNWKVAPFQWGCSITAFNRQITNWILWMPRENQLFWSPDNIARVWSRGLEHRAHVRYQHSSWMIKVAAGYDFIRSTNQIAVENPQIEKGQQLYYTPRHQAFASLSIHWKDLFMQYRHRYTGPVSALNVTQLAEYHIGYFSFSYALKSNWGDFDLLLQLNNAWNTDYRVVERRLMPGRNGTVGIRWDFYVKSKIVEKVKR